MPNKTHIKATRVTENFKQNLCSLMSNSATAYNTKIKNAL